MEEVWKDVVGYEGLYKISNLGNVYSLYTNKELSKVTRKDGYQYVSLSKNKSRKLKLIHRLVAEAFIPNPDNLPIINHKDEKPSNNRVDNLEWCTYSYNNSYNNVAVRRAEPLRKRVYAYNIKGDKVYEFESAQEACRALNLSSGNLSDCCNGIIKTYYNLAWSYSKLSLDEIKERFSVKPEKYDRISKKVKQYNLEGDFIAEYPSTRETGRQLGFSSSLIARVCRGEAESTHGWVFKYE